MDTSKAKSRPNPREKAKPLSVLLWWWTVGIFKKGYTKVLAIDDLYDPLKQDRSTLLGDRLEKQWNIELQKTQKFKTKPNLLKVIFFTFWPEIFHMGMLHVIIEFIFRLGSPLLLGRLLQYFKPDTLATYQEGLIYAGALTLNNILTILSSNHLLFMAYYLGGRVRIAVCSLVYRKALTLSKTALGETAPGKIVNLVANDVNRFDLVMIFLHNMWTAPLSTIIVGYILYREAHVAALIGIAVLMTIVPIQVYSGKLSSQYRLRTAIKTDERVRLMDEIISGVQVIKMYAWEKPFCALVEMARYLELRIVRKTSFLRGLFMTFFLFTTRAALYCTLVAMLHFGEDLTADKIFVFASFYTVLAQSMTAMFARGFAEIAECRVSVGRIQSFLLLDEFREGNVQCLEDRNVNGKRLSLVTKEKDVIGEVDGINGKHGSVPELGKTTDETWSIRLDNVTAKWYPELTDNTLENIDLRLERGKLYVVIGTVGSGKSSLLSAILGEINLMEGGIKVRGSLSYVGQDAWVFGSSVRQNILFGQEFDRQRYQRVVKACSLFKDFSQFPEGDHTIVGERGSSLSGGQKARISLARAVYRQADIYLLDDPLSAVDAHVGKHLFEECIRRYLRGKTRILATHQLQFIKDVDGIILLDQGKMQYYDDYHKLLAAYPEYRSLIAADKEENSNEDVSVDRGELRRRFSSTGSKSRVSESGDIEIAEDNDDSRNLEDLMESTSKGVVKGNVFLQYFRSGSNICITFFMIILFLATQVFVSLNDYCVPFIVNAEESRSFYNTRKNSSNETAAMAEEDLYSTEFYIYVYTAIVVSIFVVGMSRAFIYYILCLRSSERLHNSAFAAIIRTNLRFFDTNPSGRILNRFSKDTSAMDELLPKAMLDSGQVLLSIAGAVVLTCLVNPIFVLPAAIIGLVCYWIKKVYLKTSKNIKRLEGMTRSPVFTHLNATLNGISTIRAYGAQSILKNEFDRFQDVHTSSWYMYTACSLAFAFALDLFTFSFITFITFTFIVFRENFNGGQVGLAITQMMSIGGLVQWGMRQAAEVTNQMMSVERILEYTQIPPEDNLGDASDTLKGKKVRTLKPSNKLPKRLVVPPKDWPSKGAIEFQSVFMRYAEKEEPVLKDLNFSINPSEKIGIVGRTGAGKSSLISASFRLAPLEGVITIDGIDTGTVSLEDLRSRISIIPQDPVLFSGTLRRNLDPFEEFPDKELWEALEEVELKDAIVASGNGLNCRVLDRGSNFSVGQRQLVCLARAILRNNKVLMLDEATANVDPQTDALIQRTIRTKFASCTVLTVAHRLNTIIDSDRVIVMDKGRLVELNHPYILLQKDNGQFTSLVKETGDAMFQQLFEAAKKCYDEKYVDHSEVIESSYV